MHFCAYQVRLEGGWALTTDGREGKKKGGKARAEMKVVQAERVPRVVSKREQRLLKRNAARRASHAGASSAEALPRIAEDAAKPQQEITHLVCFILLVSLFILVWAKQHETIS